MQKTDDRLSGAGILPDNYVEVLSWKVTGKPQRVISLNIVGLILIVIFGWIFYSLALSLGRLPLKAEFNIGLGEMGLLVAGILLTLVLHELAHGLFMQIFGAKPRYGILWKGLMLYTTSPGYAYPRNNYAVIALAPFVLISLMVILGMWLLQGSLWVALMGICGIVNASGAVGDLWMTMIVLRYPVTAYVIDEQDGIRVFLPRP